jgi:multidrug efflux pump subunit AcrA (membrane-fusion protein)
MKNKNGLLKFLFGVVLILFAGTGIWIYHSFRAMPQAQAQVHAKYQCPMHPQIIRDEPGDCPICHMHLQLVEMDEAAPIPAKGLAAENAVPDHAAFSLSAERRQLIGVRSEPARLRTLLRTLRLPGRVGEDFGSVLAQALEMDGSLLKTGLEAEVWVTGEGARKARVVSVDRSLDVLSRTFGVRLALLESIGSSVRPGVYCDVRVLLKLGQGVSVSKEAVLDTGDRQWVFVQKEGGRFEPRAVQLGKEGDQFVVIRKGLAAGELVVSSANFLIDSESRFQAATRDFGGGGHD